MARVRVISYGQPALGRGDDQGDPSGDKGPDRLETGDGLGVFVRFRLERKKAGDGKTQWVDECQSA